MPQMQRRRPGMPEGPGMTAGPTWAQNVAPTAVQPQASNLTSLGLRSLQSADVDSSIPRLSAGLEISAGVREVQPPGVSV